MQNYRRGKPALQNREFQMKRSAHAALLPLVRSVIALALLLPFACGASERPRGAIEQRVDGSIAMIEATDETYRAVIVLDPSARSTARALDLQRRAPGLLHGEPVLLKDNIESVGQLSLGALQFRVERCRRADAQCHRPRANPLRLQLGFGGGRSPGLRRCCHRYGNLRLDRLSRGN